MYTTTYTAPIGKLTLASDGDNLTGLWLAGQKYYGATLAEGSLTKDDLGIFVKTKRWLDRYFAGEQPQISELSLAPSGSQFRQAVWQILTEIPYGAVTTYGAIAKEMAQRLHKDTMSGQAVGGAVGHNPISIIIPCHRVVGANGSLTGYAGGLPAKKYLLTLEGADQTRLFVPEKGTAL